jgi:hypothetical protein
MNIKPHTQKKKECVCNKTTTTNVWELKKKKNTLHITDNMSAAPKGWSNEYIKDKCG